MSIPEAAHMSPLTRPEAVAKTIHAHLSDAGIWQHGLAAELAARLLANALVILPVFPPTLVGFLLKRSAFIPDAFWPQAERMTYFASLPVLVANPIATSIRVPVLADGPPLVRLPDERNDVQLLGQPLDERVDAELAEVPNERRKAAGIEALLRKEEHEMLEQRSPDPIPGARAALRSTLGTSAPSAPERDLGSIRSCAATAVTPAPSPGSVSRRRA